ncbi:hypothetical protein CISIN_1g045064mg [Citrus sinensis]|uniref:RING-type domain-containing protein n=1 Tax=Citrus sinensis TaxID=2711 RepID=A0A067EY50_CITSI|nr:hypothetical protein CISIN_1g045064mg [Citrus sinensis]
MADDNDEAIARALQEMEDGGTENMFIKETNGISTDANPILQSIQPMYQDEFYPDNMDYEEITRLEETIGNVSRGLSERKISRLPSHKCAICKLEYERGDRLITLPCGHKYHDECIKTWLRDNENCCICREEVVV